MLTSHLKLKLKSLLKICTILFLITYLYLFCFRRKTEKPEIFLPRFISALQLTLNKNDKFILKMCYQGRMQGLGNWGKVRKPEKGQETGERLGNRKKVMKPEKGQKTRESLGNWRKIRKLEKGQETAERSGNRRKVRKLERG